MISCAEILGLFQPILARIDLAIIFADRDGKVLACNDAARQILRLEQHEAPTTLSDVNGFDLLARIEQEDGTDPIAAHSLCRNATQIEIQVGSPLDEPAFVQVRTGTVELPCDNGELRILMLQDITHLRHLAAVAAARDQSQVLTQDPQMLDLLGRITSIAPTDASVLLQGESGTGKTLRARPMPRAAAPNALSSRSTAARYPPP